MYLMQHFYEQHGKYLGLALIVGGAGLSRRISKAEVQRPGLSLAGYLKGSGSARLLVVGKQEIEYLRDLDAPTRLARLTAILTPSTPGVIVARGFRPPKEIVEICEKQKIPLFKSNSTATNLLSRITFLLLEEFCPSVTLHGTLVEVFGVGVLIQGESSVGKSEAALGLIERGHRLISDDVVRVKKKEGSYLVGSGPELTRHLMEIRGIGIINVAHLYGAVCVRPDKGLDIVVKLEEWDDKHFYDRVGLDEKFIDVLGVSVPYHVLPVKPGRDVVLLLETIALNHRLKDMGYNSAKEFNAKLLEAIARRQKKRITHEARL
ncbi:MAG: HPr kinase/phosphorylase [Verrucomicrobiota bacterium]|nr:HPr kinase/phosphorylase [Verrucomicrobiota bacterium]